MIKSRLNDITEEQENCTSTLDHFRKIYDDLYKYDVCSLEASGAFCEV